MGIVERRGVRQFQEGKYPSLKEEIEKAAGFSVPIEVDWNSLGIPDYAHAYEEGFTKVWAGSVWVDTLAVRAKVRIPTMVRARPHVP